MKKRIFFLIVFCLIAYFAIVRTALIGEFLLSRINSRLNPQQLVLTADSPRASLLGFSAKSFSFKFPSALSSFDLGELQLSPSWLALLGGRIGADLNAGAYAGKVDAGVVASFKGVVQQLDVKINQLSLVQLPVAAILSLSSGLLDLDIRMERLDSVDQRNGRFRLELHNVARPQTQYSAIAELAKLPSINVSQLILDGRLDGQKVEFTNANINSDLGTISGTGSLNISSLGAIAEIDVKLKCNLSTQGLATLGPLFQSSTDFGLAHLDPIFAVRIVGSPQARTVRMVKDGS